MTLRFILSALIAVFTIGFLPEQGFAQRSKAILKGSPTVWQGLDSKGKPVSCAFHNNKNLVVRQSGRNLINVAVKIKELNVQLKNSSLDPKLQKRLTKQRKNLVAYRKAAAPFCNLGIPIPPTPTPTPTPTPIPAQYSMEPVSGTVNEASARYILRKIGFGYTDRSNDINPSNEQQFVQRATTQSLTSAINHFVTVKPRNQALFDRVRDRFDITLGNLSTQLRSAESDEGYREALLDWDVNTDDAFTHNLRHFMMGLWTIGTTAFTQNPANNPQRVLGRDYVFGLLDSVSRTPHLPSHLFSMVTDPAMLLWLDNSSNKASLDPFTGQITTNVNENFAREVQELFGLGTHRINDCSTGSLVENYSEDFQGNRVLGDVYQTALALTGMIVTQVDVGGTFYWRYGFTPADHYPYPVTLYRGTSHQKTLTQPQQIVSAIYDHPGASQFLARQLAEFYLTTEPPCELIMELAKVVKDKDYNIREIMKVFAASKAFNHPSYKGTLILDPWRISVSFVRQIGLNRGLRVSPTEPNNPSVEVGINIRSRENDITLSSGMEFNPLNPIDGVFWFPKTFSTSNNVQMKSANFMYNVLTDTTAINHLEWNAVPRFVPENSLELPSALDVVDYAAGKIGISLNNDQRSQLAFFLDNTKNAQGQILPSRFDHRVHEGRVRQLLFLLGIQASNLIQ